MTRDKDSSGGWWGDYALTVGQAAHWRIGPLALTVRRGRREWQVGYDWDPDRIHAKGWERLAEAPSEEPANQERFVVGETGDRVSLRPALPDRAVVSLPRVPLHLLPEREITLYVGSPVWVAIAGGNPASNLRELPLRLLSDTWFGGSTRDGELCFATQTRACLNSENLPVLSRSALTSVAIRNQAADPLLLERLKLPVPLLSLYRDPQGRLWTEGVTLTRTEGSGMASLDIRPGPPDEAGATELLAGPRDVSESRPLIRAFSRLLGLE